MTAPRVHIAEGVKMLERGWILLLPVCTLYYPFCVIVGVDDNLLFLIYNKITRLSSV